MLEQFLIFTQCTVCLGCLFMVLIRPNKTIAQKLLGWIMLLAGISLYGDLTFYYGHSEPKMLVILDAICQFITPCIAPLILITIWAVFGQKIRRWDVLGWFSLPVILGMTSAVLYGMVGVDDAAKMMPYLNQNQELPAEFQTPCGLAHVFVERVLFYIVLGAEMLALLIYIIIKQVKDKCGLSALGKFIMGKADMDTRNVWLWFVFALLLTVICRCLVSQTYYANPWIGAILATLMSTIICIISHLMLNVNANRIKFNQIGALSPIEVIIEEEEISEPVVLSVIKAENNEDGKLMETNEILAAHAAGINMTSEEYAQLLNDFNRLLKEEKGYLREDFSLGEVVEALGVNRSYLSYLVNHEFCMSFRDVIGNMRIEYAMNYMKEHPGCLQDIVATECGFSSASTFNRKFTQVVGMTPRLWLTRNAQQSTTNDTPQEEI